MSSFLLWGGLGLLLAAAIAVDLGIHRKAGTHPGLRHAIWMSVGYVALGLAFGAGVFVWMGRDSGFEYLTAYILEKSLSLDNVFVFAMIFGAFAVNEEAQRRALLYGVVGALVMRAVLIYAGVEALKAFGWLTYVFAAVLLYGAWRMYKGTDDADHPQDNPIVRWLQRHIRMTDDYVGRRFVVRRDGLLWATPLVPVLVLIEVSDLIFATDSIPAVLAVSQDAFIVFSSNAFAVLGLRALYFVVAEGLREIEGLNRALALVLGIVAIKLIASHFVEIPAWAMLAVILAILGATALRAVIRRRRS